MEAEETRLRKFPLRVQMIRPFRRDDPAEDLAISSIHPMRPLFLCALLYTALVWLVVVFSFLTSTSDWVMVFWLESHSGMPSIMQSMKYVSMAFVAVSFLEMIFNPKNTGCRVSFFYCVLLAFYCFWIDRNFVHFGRFIEMHRILAR